MSTFIYVLTEFKRSYNITNEIRYVAQYTVLHVYLKGFFQTVALRCADFGFLLKLGNQN